jgi:hypothetical protein
MMQINDSSPVPPSVYKSYLLEAIDWRNPQHTWRRNRLDSSQEPSAETQKNIAKTIGLMIGMVADLSAPAGRRRIAQSVVARKRLPRGYHRG